MIYDAQNQYSDAQALTATGASTNLIDHGAAERRLGSGEPLGVGISVDTALAGTTPTFVAALQSDDAVAFPSPTVVAQSKSYDALAAGARVIIPLPPGQATERFTRMNYILGGTTPTITVTAFLAPLSFLGEWAAYADGFNIT